MTTAKTSKKLYIFAGVFLLICIALVVFKQLGVNTYHSDSLNVTIAVPQGFSIEEKFGEILLTKDKKMIILHWIDAKGKYKNIDAFLAASYKDNPPTKVEKKHLTINNLEGVSYRIIYERSPEFNSKSYYFSVKGGFYDIYTYSNSQDLYPELDQIAQSFRYEP